MWQKIIILSVFILSLGICSCERERLSTEQEESGEWVEISLLTASKGNPSSVIDPDYEINSLRVLAFHSTTGYLKFNSGKIDLSSTLPPVTFEIMTGSYDFVFIANEHSVTDDHLTISLDGWIPGSNKVFTSLDQETFPYNAFSMNKDLPATSVYRNVRVTGDKELNYYDSGSNAWVHINESNQLWKVEVERLAVRLDIQLLVDAESRNDITGICFGNLPDQVPFFQEKLSDNSTNYYEGGYQETYPLSFISVNEFIPTGPDTDGMYTYSLERIILPASVFPDITNEAKAITIEVHTSSTPQQPLRKALGQAIPTDYTSPRNLYYKIEGNILEKVEEPIRVLFVITTDIWTIENIQGNMNGDQKKLNVEKLSVSVFGSEITRVHFWSDQPYVIVDETGYLNIFGGTTFNVNDYLNELAGNTALNLHYDPLTGAGYIDVRVKEGVTIPSDKLRVYLDAAGLRREIILYIDN